MSDPSGDGGSAAMQELLAQLSKRPPQQSPRSEIASAIPPLTMASPSPPHPQNPSNPPHVLQFSAVSPIPPPSGVMSPADSTGQDRKTHLLSLLNFGGQKENASPSPAARSSLPVFSGNGQQHVRGISASDLVGSSMGKPVDHEAATPSPAEDAAAAVNPQDQLLSLLNKNQQQRPTASPRASYNSGTRSPALTGVQSSASPAQNFTIKAPTTIDTSAATAGTPPPNRDSPIRVFGSRESREHTPFEPQDLPAPAAAPSLAPKSTDNKGMFTYVNPFEQLASSRKNNADAAGVNGSAAKQPSSQQPPSPGPIHKTIGQNVEIASPAPVAEGRSRVEALMGIGAPTTDPEVISQAIENVTEKIEKQVAFEASQSKSKPQTGKKGKKEPSSTTHIAESSNQLPTRPIPEIKKEPEEEVRRSLENLSANDTSEAMQDMMDDAAVADDEESSANDDEAQVVPVFNIPLRPFVAIELVQTEPPTLKFRERSINDIARVKKEFDQIDRNLVTASNDHIIYATPKKPFGIRVIAQEDGKDKQFFKENDPIFNVAICSSPSSKDQEISETVIATGTSGSVYWSLIKHDSQDQQEEDPSSSVLIFPPFTGHDGDHTSGGQLKTRAKKSNRHPEFFAIGRGKTIQVVFPFHAMKSDRVSKANVINTEAYFKERSLKINTGKAGKDFTFSEDDTVLASLDKAGRLRFWDVRDLVDSNNGTVDKLAPMEVNTPIMTVPTAHVNDKAWPTSVLFVDKLRPYVRGCALRYVIVGMKQNHTLQLWDLGLGKVVQELALPHENESDAICSVAYHPATGIIVVGHPTRNSIYFIHLSAPKYNLPGTFTQARYLQAIIQKDSSVPKPESTAIMSGIREYSFASKGQIRSLDLLSSQSSVVDKKPDDDRGQFELYVMHSKGVTFLTIRKADLGWSHDNKVITKVNGEEEGIIKVRNLQELKPVEVSEMSSVNGDAIGSTKGVSSRALSPIPEPSGGKDTDAGASETPMSVNATPAGKSERRKKKRTEHTSDIQYDGIPPPAPVPPPVGQQAQSLAPPTATSSSSKREPKTPRKEVKEEVAPVSRQLALPSSETAVVADGGVEAVTEVVRRELKQIEDNVKSSVRSAFEGELKVLRRGIDEDRRTADATSAGHLEAVLRLVSQALTENVDAALNNIVTTNIQDKVVPAVNQNTEKALRKSVPEWLHNTLQQQMVSQLKTAVPTAIGEAMRNQHVLQALTEGVTGKISKRIDQEIRTTVIPPFQKLVADAHSESQRQLQAQLKAAEVKALDDNTKIERLTMMTEELLETMRRMSEVQSTMRDEMSALQEEVARLRTAQLTPPSPAALATVEAPDESPREKEFQDVVNLISNGFFEEGTIKWLQSENQETIFTRFFCNQDPSYLQHCPGLVNLSVGAAVLQTLDDHLQERIHWVTAALTYLDPLDTEVKSVAPKIMDLIVQRLESRYMSLAEASPGDAMLRQIPGVVKRAREIKSVASLQAPVVLR